MNNLLRFKFAFLTFLLIIANAPAAHAQREVRPEIKWLTLTTPHFKIIFDAKQQELGRLYAEKLEQAHAELKKYFRSMPETTTVVINDKTDSTNGYATPVPYPHIMAYPVLPGPNDSLADTGDWALEFLAHEYTHILTFEPANGIMQSLRWIFGSVITPNALLPQWWKEGLAVEIETRLGSQGRLRSSFQDATLRAMVLDDTLKEFDIAKANEASPGWPEGARPYLFGSLMWSQMIQDRGTAVIAKLNEQQGSRIPYFIEDPAKEHLLMSYPEQYDRMIEETTRRANDQLAKLRQSTPTKFILPRNSFTSVIAPAISPDGTYLAVVTEDDANSRTVKLLKKTQPGQSFLDAKSVDTIEKLNEAFTTNTTSDGPPGGSIQRISWFPNSEKMAYDKIDYINNIERFSDIYTYDLVSKKTVALTKGLRGREPTVSLDSKQIAFVKLEGGKTHLGILNLDGPKITEEILFSPEIQQRISYPLFWDEDTLLFSLRDTSGNEGLVRYTISSGKRTQLFIDHKAIRFAQKTSEGLIFSSAKNGVFNLYLADSNLQSARPITHSLTAIHSADIDPQNKEIFATQMTSQGLKVSAVKIEEWQKTPAQLPQINPLMADRYGEGMNLSPAERFTFASTGNAEEYSPYKYLWPQYWVPFVFGSTSSKGLLFQVRTSGFDPLKKHTYSVIGSWDTGTQQGGIEASYLNQVTSTPIGGTLFRKSSYLGSVANELVDSGASIFGVLDVFSMSKYANAQVGWQHVDRSLISKTTKRTGPFGILTYTAYTQSGAQISPESGMGAYFGASEYLPLTGYLSHSQFLAGGEVYFSSFLPKHHALMFRANGVYTPNSVGAIFGAATESLVFQPDSPLPQYILRGYQRGQIYGKNLIATNTEYRFPLLDLYRGSGTWPLFLRRLSGGIVADALVADGIFLNTSANEIETINMKRAFCSAGAEVKIESTVGYLLPINFVLGYYLAFNGPKGAEGSVGGTLQISGF